METAKHYNYFRDYDPGIGRYVESDPIGLEAGTDTYSYVFGSPLAYRDSSGLDAWNRDPGQRWKLKGANVPHPGSLNPNLYIFVNCFQRCYPQVVIVTATSNDHKSGPHVIGQAVDFKLPDGAAGSNAAMCCAFECGAKFAIDEYHYPTANATGGHIHAQLVPGQGGATGTGSKPKPKCSSCSMAAGTGVN